MAIPEAPDATHNPERRTFLAQASASLPWHGRRWSSQFAMSGEEERTFLRQAA
ncbi:hypothetical protein [Pseudomonas brassicacearum]|uniref:hypothetical protein n=1 Tax=Pseudomonas brassicacearum TaxID=930166 RepID=UPI0004BAC0F1|nr:hypothetical protein [Pseudomonas brassicacearum]